MSTPPASGQNPNDGWKLPQLPSDQNYKPEFKINVDQWRGYWQSLFKGQPLTDTQVHQMTDQFVKYVWNEMNRVLQHALKTQKKLEQKRKEEENS